MSEFDEIRPYNDEEVPDVLERLVNDNELLNSLIRLRFSRSVGPLGFAFRVAARAKLKKETKNIKTVADLQAFLEKYVLKVVDDTITELSTSGLDVLDKSASFLFISNHRDIAMDPALVNLTLYQKGFSTLRIAIGDNLLTKPFASDLMRLNKCFIVNRSHKARRDKLNAAKLLSKYIHHSVLTDKENVWLAQREGRAKDGLDRTNPAIISMLSLSKPESQSLSNYINEANIVPVSISYEYDPCDVEKAREMHMRAKHGSYEKEEHEDVESIARGITGKKGRVHVAFGKPLSGEFTSSEAVTKMIDTDIMTNYCLHPSNCIAYELLEKKTPIVRVSSGDRLFSEGDYDEERALFKDRIDALELDYRSDFLASYANPVRDRLAQDNLKNNSC